MVNPFNVDDDNSEDESELNTNFELSGSEELPSEGSEDPANNSKKDASSSPEETVVSPVVPVAPEPVVFEPPKKIIPPPPPKPKIVPPPSPDENLNNINDENNEEKEETPKWLPYTAIAVSIVAILMAGYSSFFGGGGTISGSDIAENAITSSKIAPGAVSKEELAPDAISAGPQGEPGKEGATGPVGPAGVKNITVKTKETKASASSEQNLTVSCEEKQTVLTGGVSVIGDVAKIGDVVIQQAGPTSDNGNKWNARAISVGKVKAPWSLRLTVTCGVISKVKKDIDSEKTPAQTAPSEEDTKDSSGSIDKKESSGNKGSSAQQKELDKFEEKYGIK